MRLDDLGAVDRVQEDGRRCPGRDLGGCRVSPGEPVTYVAVCRRRCRVRAWWRGFPTSWVAGSWGRLSGGGRVTVLAQVSSQRENVRCLHLLKEKGRSLEVELFRFHRPLAVFSFPHSILEMEQAI